MKQFFTLFILLFSSSTLQAQFRVRADGDSNVEQAKDFYIGYFGDANYRMRHYSSASAAIIDYQPDLYFRVAPVLGASYPVTLRLKTNGYLGLGVTDPSYRLDVNGSVRAVSYITISDIRLKKDVFAINNSLDKINLLKGITYTYNTSLSKSSSPMLKGEDPQSVKLVDTNETKQYFGFSAQDVKVVLPQVVHEDKDGYLGVDYVSLIPVLVEAIKEQQGMINSLREELKKITK
jgi:hypothetical protein